MSQDVVAAQPHLPIMQVSSQTIVAFVYATSFLSKHLYDLIDVAPSVTLRHVQVSHGRPDPRHLLYPL